MTEELNLKNCPFCGGMAAIEMTIDMLEQSSFVAGCVSLECYISPGTDGFQDIEDAAKAWNKRNG